MQVGNGSLREFGSNRYPGAGGLEGRDDLRAFAKYLKARGFSKESRCRNEGLRVRGGDRLVIVYENDRQGFTVMERDYDLLKAFLEAQREGGQTDDK